MFYKVGKIVDSFIPIDLVLLLGKGVSLLLDLNLIKEAKKAIELANDKFRGWRKIHVQIS